MKLILGAAQFGKVYGAFNKKLIKFTELKKSIDLAKKNNIFFVDTSFNYKNSHKVIKKLKLKNFKIITKLKLNNNANVNYLFNQVKHELKRLKIKNFYAILIHDYRDLIYKNGKKFLNELYKLKKKKLVTKIGLSIYSPADLEKVWKFWKPEVVQAPFNVFDKRMHDSGWLRKFKKNKIIFIARSVFLQGILLQDFNCKFKNLKKLNNYIYLFKAWFNWCKQKNISQVRGCLDYLKKFKNINYAVIGFNSYSQLKEILLENKKIKYDIPDSFNSNKKTLIDPRKW